MVEGAAGAGFEGSVVMATLAALTALYLQREMRLIKIALMWISMASRALVCISWELLLNLAQPGSVLFPAVATFTRRLLVGAVQGETRPPVMIEGIIMKPFEVRGLVASVTPYAPVNHRFGD